jgi:hypothetical protein
VSVRRIRPDGAQGDVIGFVLGSDPERLRLRDRRGVVHDLAWAEVLAWRPVGVARGRDPLRTPRAELDGLASSAGIRGRVFVARLSSLLDGRPPDSVDEGAEPSVPARLEGEWVSVGDCDDYLALARWAAHRDARSMQVRTSNPDCATALRELGFTELD